MNSSKLGKIEIVRRAPQYLLELGSWELRALNVRIERMRREYGTVVERAAAWAKLLRGTPFEYESRLPSLLHLDAMRVRFASFDCITFCYTVIALSGARDFDEFVRRMYALRYVAKPNFAVSNAIETGNFIDFACEAFLFNAGRHFLCDMTAAIAQRSQRIEVNMQLRAFARAPDKDADQNNIYPRYPKRRLRTSIIASECAHSPAISNAILAGDLILFTKGSTGIDGRVRDFFVCHAGIAYRRGRMLGMTHSTPGYYRSAKGSSRRLPYVRLDRTTDAMLPGVAVSGCYLGDNQIIECDGMRYFGYDLDRARSLAEYAKQNFLGFKILRPTS